MEGQDMKSQEENNNFYHICTSGLCSSLLFRDEAEYVDGMNEIPLCAIPSGIEILAFCLMSNHVHFIARGEFDACVNFIRLFKKQRSAKLGIALVEAEICVKELQDAEYLLTAIGYVLRNPLAAGLKLMPGEYRWSSAHLYFAERSRREEKGRRLSELTARERRVLLKSRQDLPENYRISEEGFILPSSYVQYKVVERMFSSPRQLLFHLSRNKDIDVELETGIVAKTRYRDEELLASLQVMCAEKFRGRKFASLKIEDRLLLANDLRRKYGASTKQVARVTALSGDILASL